MREVLTKFTKQPFSDRLLKNWKNNSLCISTVHERKAFFSFTIRFGVQLGMRVHAFNLGTEEAEAGRDWLPGEQD